MTVVCVTGDFHGQDPPAEIPACDLLLITGDIGLNEWGLTQARMRLWLEEVPNGEDVVAIAGNHDFDTQPLRQLPWIYLQDEWAIVQGLKVWGSPWSPTFNNWAFMRDDAGLAEIWSQIPNDVDIILVHGPPHGFGDYAQRKVHTGSVTLRNRIQMGDFPNLKLIACGHIHEGYGVWASPRHHWLVANGSWVDETYKPGNPPLVIDLPGT